MKTQLSLTPDAKSMNPCELDKNMLKKELSEEFSKNFKTRSKVGVSVEDEEFKLTPKEQNIYALNVTEYESSVLACIANSSLSDSYNTTNMNSLCANFTDEQSGETESETDGALKERTAKTSFSLDSWTVQLGRNAYEIGII